jgi:plasmid stabilization system protein ParE
MANLIIHSGADDDFHESYLYYAQIGRDLAERFDEQVKAALDRIATKPMGGTTYNEMYRFYSLKNFPHLVLYEYANDIATVIAIYHPSREPNYWRKR